MFNFNFQANDRGQIALPFVLLVGGIIVEIVIAGSIVAFFTNAETLGERLSTRALAAANSGIYDAISRISMDKEFGAGGTSYTMDVGSDSVTVDISRTTNDSANNYVYTIESTATARSRQRKMEAKVVVDQTTGEISLRSVEEVSVQ